ncbi:MAG: hypothetical protein PHE79_01010 [Eubacteriales bacterium]|nr:hypothetical protein [Eubacteriales bacterium]
MRKQVIFYIVWDVLLYLMLFAICNIGNWMQKAYFRMEYSFAAGPLFLIVSWMTVGALIGWLVFVTSKYEHTRKSAVLEFVVVGGFSLYLASIFFLYFSPVFVNMGLLNLVPRWMLLDKTTIILGSILFGYELCIFIIRMVKCRKNAEPTDD